MTQALTTLVSTFLTFAPLHFPMRAAPPAAFHVYEANKQNSSCCCAEIMFRTSQAMRKVATLKTGNIRCAASILNDQMLEAVNGEGQSEGRMT